MRIEQSALFSVHALQNTKRTQTRLFERLASGRQVNRAVDNSAVLSLSQKFEAAVRSMDQGARNLSDGISVAQIAEGALNESSNLLGRMRELAVQAQNGTLSGEQRAALQQEYDALASEISRIAESTEFNGRQLLNGDLSSEPVSFEDGAAGNVESTELRVDDQSAASLGVEGLDLSDPAALDALDAAITSVASTRSSIGITAGRLTSEITSLLNNIENTQAANSRMVDTDYANELSQLTNNQIREQFQIAVAGQANLVSTSVLQLLK